MSSSDPPGGPAPRFANSQSSVKSAEPQTTAKNEENKFSSSSSSFTSATSAKYKSIEKITSKNREFTSCVESDKSPMHDDVPPPLPRSAAPPLHRQNATKIPDSIESDDKPINNDNDVHQNSDSRPPVAASPATCRYAGDEVASSVATNGGSGADSSLSTRRSRIDCVVAGASEEERPVVVGRRSRSGSNCNSNRIAQNSVAPYIPAIPSREVQQYMTYQRYAPIQVPAIYTVNQHSQSTDQISDQSRSAPCKMQMFRFLEIAIRRILFHMAKAATQFQITFRVLPLLLTLLPLIALYWMRSNLNVETPPFETFMPDATVESRGEGNFFDASLYHKYFAAAAAIGPTSTTSAADFNGSNPMFDAPRRTSPYEFSIILSTTDPNGNILNNGSLAAYRRLFALIRNISVTHSLVRLEWVDMCREKCTEEDRKVITAIQTHQLLLKYPEAVVLKTVDTNDKSADNPFYNVNRIFLANILGGVELDMDGIISRARSLLLNIKLKETLKSQTLVAFENCLRDVLTNFSASIADVEELELNTWSFRAYINEVMHAAKDSHVRLSICFAIFAVLCFSVLGFCHRNAYKCRPFVALQIVFVVAFSALLSYAVHLLGAGGTLNYALYPSLFVLCALATLLFAVVAQCFSRYSLAALHPIEKLAFIYSWDMPVFVGTTLALSAAAAGCACMVENALIRQLLSSLATGLMTLLIFGLLYLTVFWYAAEKREASGLKWFQICKMGDESFNNKYVFDYDELICDRLHEKLADLRPSVPRWLGQLASRNHFRTLCAVAYTAFLIFAGVGLFASDRRRVQLREDFFVANSSANDSSASFLQRFDSAYEKYADYVEMVFELPVDYYNKRNKERIFDLLRWPLDTQYATRTVSWLLDFERFQKSTIFDVNPETIVPVINYVFLKSDAYRKYATDIVFDRFQTQILRSRMYLELSSKGIASGDVLIRELERRAKEANLPVVFNAPYAFLLRHDRYAFHISLTAFACLAGFLTLACLVLFTHAVIWLSVPLSLLLATIGACGALQMAGVPFNIVTMSTVLIGNLYTAAVTIHFCYAFNNAGLAQDTNTKRMKYAFQCTLWPTVLATALPILCYFPLLIGGVPPVVLHVFKALIAILLFTFFNYLFLLPSVTVILTDYISSCAATVNNFCDAQACCVVEQPAESVYFVPSHAGGGMHALPSVHATRSIASFYNAPNYIMNDALMLPPAYDYRQRMITAAEESSSPPPPPPPPPLPPLPNSASNSAGRRSLCSQLNGSTQPTTASTRTSVLCAEQLSSSYPNAFRSPHQRQRKSHFQQSSAQSPRSPGSNARQRLANTASFTGVGSPYRSHRTVAQESADNSNCDSVDSRQAPSSNRRDGPAIAGLRRDFSANASPADSPRVGNVKRRTAASASHSKPAMRGENSEQIYEEPESPVVLRPPRRSHSDGRRRNAIFDTASADGAALGAKSSFSPHVLRREIADQMASGSTAAQPASVMQPNWRQYLLNGDVATNGAGARPAGAQPAASPSANHRRYRF